MCFAPQPPATPAAPATPRAVHVATPRGAGAVASPRGPRSAPHAAPRHASDVESIPWKNLWGFLIGIYGIYWGFMPENQWLVQLYFPIGITIPF